MPPPLYLEILPSCHRLEDPIELVSATLCMISDVVGKRWADIAGLYCVTIKFLSVLYQYQVAKGVSLL